MPTKTKTFIAAVGPVGGGSTKLLLSDLPPKDSGKEPIAAISKALLKLGVQRESVDALVERTTAPTAKRRARQAAQAGARARAYAAVEHVRKSVSGADDEFVLALLDGSAIPFVGSKHRAVFKAAKHDGRQHPETGRFTPMTEARKVKDADGIVWTVQDTRRRIPWALDGGKHEPSGGGDPEAGQLAYGDGTGTPNPGGNR